MPERHDMIDAIESSCDPQNHQQGVCPFLQNKKTQQYTTMMSVLNQMSHARNPFLAKKSVRKPFASLLGDHTEVSASDCEAGSKYVGQMNSRSPAESTRVLVTMPTMSLIGSELSAKG